MNTDTPRTDSCPYCGAGIYAPHCAGDEITYWRCGSDLVAEWGLSRSADCYERELAASQAECAKWRKVAESLAHKNNVKLDQRKFAKQDWWDKKLANDK
jgi:hypothetical protein